MIRAAPPVASRAGARERSGSVAAMGRAARAPRRRRRAVIHPGTGHRHAGPPTTAPRARAPVQPPLRAQSCRSSSVSFYRCDRSVGAAAHVRADSRPQRRSQWSGRPPVQARRTSMVNAGSYVRRPVMIGRRACTSVSRDNPYRVAPPWAGACERDAEQMRERCLPQKCTRPAQGMCRVHHDLQSSCRESSDCSSSAGVARVVDSACSTTPATTSERPVYQVDSKCPAWLPGTRRRIDVVRERCPVSPAFLSHDLQQLQDRRVADGVIPRARRLCTSRRCWARCHNTRDGELALVGRSWCDDIRSLRIVIRRIRMNGGAQLGVMTTTLMSGRWARSRARTDRIWYLRNTRGLGVAGAPAERRRCRRGLRTV